MHQQGAQLIWGGILGLVGGFILQANARYLLGYDQSAVDTQYSTAGAWMNILMGALLIWGALRAIRPSSQPSGLALWAIVWLCGIYIAVPLLHAKGYLDFSWSSEPPMAYMIGAGIVMVVTIKRIRG